MTYYEAKPPKPDPILESLVIIPDDDGAESYILTQGLPFGSSRHDSVHDAMVDAAETVGVSIDAWVEREGKPEWADAVTNAVADAIQKFVGAVDLEELEQGGLFDGGDDLEARYALSIDLPPGCMLRENENGNNWELVSDAIEHASILATPSVLLLPQQVLLTPMDRANPSLSRKGPLELKNGKGAECFFAVRDNESFVQWTITLSVDNGWLTIQLFGPGSLDRDLWLRAFETISLEKLPGDAATMA